MNQYFQIGEEVFIESEDTPSFNCESTVLDVSYGTWEFDDGSVIDGFSYLMEGMDDRDWWLQSALRKKHDGAGDFESMINGLKTPLEQEQ